MTILRVGTNEKYADGWASIFGGTKGKSKKKSGTATVVKTAERNNPKSSNKRPWRRKRQRPNPPNPLKR